MKFYGALVVLLASLGFGHAQADVEGTKVLALSVADGQAVVRTAGGEMLALKEGDRLPGNDAVVTNVLVDRLVVEERVAAKPPRRETIWIYKAKNGTSRVQRLGRTDPRPSTDLRQDVRAADMMGSNRQR